MAKKEPQITVTTVFDGGLQAKGIYASSYYVFKRCRWSIGRLHLFIRHFSTIFLIKFFGMPLKDAENEENRRKAIFPPPIMERQP